MAKFLGVGAHMQELRRSRAGPFEKPALPTLLCMMWLTGLMNGKRKRDDAISQIHSAS
jgi:tRNA U55 pseudouridine synthase TruB